MRAIGAVPVLVTSLSRRTYKDGVLVEDLTAYVDATKKVGAEEYVTVIDLNQMSMAMLKKMKQAEADKFDKGNDPETGKLMAQGTDAVSATATGVDAVPAGVAGKAPAMDRTHLNPYGQKVFGRMVADAIVKTRVELGPDLIGESAPGVGARRSGGGWWSASGYAVSCKLMEAGGLECSENALGVGAFGAFLRVESNCRGRESKIDLKERLNAPRNGARG